MGSARLPRAWRAYFRMARLSAISASARAVRESSEPEARGAAAGTPRLQSPIVGTADFGDDGLARWRQAGCRHPYWRVLACRVERGERGTVLAVGGGQPLLSASRSANPG